MVGEKKHLHQGLTLKKTHSNYDQLNVNTKKRHESRKQEKCQEKQAAHTDIHTHTEKSKTTHRALLYHVRNSDFGVLFKHTGHQAITADVINTLHITQDTRGKRYTLYNTGPKSIHNI